MFQKLARTHELSFPQSEGFWLAKEVLFICTKSTTSGRWFVTKVLSAVADLHVCVHRPTDVPFDLRDS